MINCNDCGVWHGNSKSNCEKLSDECSNCGDLGYTIEINDEGVEYLANCFDCFVAAHEDDQKKVLVLRRGNTLIDVRPEPPRGVAYTLGGLS